MNSKRLLICSGVALAAVWGLGLRPATAQDPADLSKLRTQTLSNIKQLSTSMAIYCADYDDVFPYAQSTTTVQYVTFPYSKSIDQWKTYNPNGGKILFNTALGGANAEDIENPPGTVMFYESKTWPDGRRCVSYSDTSSRYADATRWKEDLKTLKLKLKKKAKPLPAKYGFDWAKEKGIIK